jgi:uncharacterized SAM-binding protein YcdF (DUF218 family)
MTTDLDQPDDVAEPHPRRRKGPVRVWTVRIIMMTLAVIVLTPPAMAARVWWQARQDERPKSDAILVLGAAQYNGKPSSILEWRLRHALTLYKDGVAPNIVTVGSKAPGDNFTEAGTGKTWLEQQGVPAAKIVAVPEGRDTLESMEAVGKTYRTQHWKSAVIVTDPWHCLRSKTMASDNGIKPACSPVRSGPSVQTRDIQFKYIVRETGGILWYGTLGRIYGEQ